MILRLGVLVGDERNNRASVSHSLLRVLLNESGKVTESKPEKKRHWALKSDVPSGRRTTHILISQINHDVRRKVSRVHFLDHRYITKMLLKTSGLQGIGQKMYYFSYFLATRNAASNTGLDLQQPTELKTTTVYQTVDVSRLPAVLVLLGKRLSKLWMIFDSTRFREHMGAIPLDIELGYVPIPRRGQYTGLYISYTVARILRLVKHLANGKVNMVGLFEQVYMENGCMDDEDCPGENAHQELAPTSMLSIVAKLTTFFEFNKFPRNMYQCQMGKQAMGTPATAIKCRVGNKMYRFQTARRLSSILLFITPTSSHEHGFDYGAIYKFRIVDLGDFRIGGDPGDLIRSYIDDTTEKTSIKKLSSRHGQKGACSQKSASVDMPCSESGIQPDVIINPHTFPSRMTIGMFVESLAGKSRTLHVVAQDVTPFAFRETFTAADYFRDPLQAARYNYHGSEPMYSGITGEKFKVDIYLEVVYYPCC
ncbi:hypothetical protein EDD21DRAFT_445263 [Dissophora ornata]|nr:hypothetical protein EDD21DRAFT_445263 [Dissophora ornata]